MTKRQIDKMNKDVEATHRVWHKFSGWVYRSFGKDLHGEWQYMTIPQRDNKKSKKWRYRSFDWLKLSQRLVGYEVMCRVKRWCNRYAPEIRIISVDDSAYAGSALLLIPHPAHGITIIFIPQCTTVQNQFFLYDGHSTKLLKELREMKKYTKSN